MRVSPNGSLLGRNEVLVAADIVAGHEQATLVEWAEQECRAGRLLENPQDAGAYQTPYQSSTGSLSRLTRRGRGEPVGNEQQFVWIPDVAAEVVATLPDAFWRIRDRVIEHLGLESLEEDPYKGSFLTYATAGASVHQHRDGNVTIDGESCDILRCNVLFSRPESGGVPVIDQSPVEIPDRGMWAFYPTALVHSATTVRGSVSRGTLSFGFLVRPRDRWDREFRLSDSVRTQYGLDQDTESRRHLIESLRRSTQAAALGASRLRVIEYVLQAEGGFTVRDAAEAIEQTSADVELALVDFQRSGLVVSAGSQLRDDMVMVF